MHGTVFAELREFVEARLGPTAWRELTGDPRIPRELPPRSPRPEPVGLFTTVSSFADGAAPTVMEEYGELIAPFLLDLYQERVRPEWRTLDLLEHAEDAIQRVVRERSPGARPARTRGVRVGPHELRLHYQSERKMCAVARGIIYGLARHFNEQVFITETACMHHGAPWCEMTIRLLK